MKTAVSIPDSIFRKAEVEAKRRGLTRSALYAQALEGFLENQTDNETTARLNEVYKDADKHLDPALRGFVHRRLNETEW